MSRGKIKQHAREKAAKTWRARERANRGFSGARAYVTHYNPGGGRFLCGKPYDWAPKLHKAAYNDKDVMCNKCQRKHTELMGTADGRKQLGL